MCELHSGRKTTDRIVGHHKDSFTRSTIFMAFGSGVYHAKECHYWDFYILFVVLSGGPCHYRQKPGTPKNAVSSNR